MKTGLAVLLFSALTSIASASSWYQVGSNLPTNVTCGLSFSRDTSPKRIAVCEQATYPASQVRVFQLNGANNWTQLGSPIAVTRVFNERSVAISGDFLVIGDAGANNYDGETRAYKWIESSSTWQLLGSPIVGSSSERAGLVVSASKTLTRLDNGTSSPPYIKIGILSHSRIRAFIWNPSSNTWTQMGSDLPSPPQHLLAGTFGSMAASDYMWYIVVSDGYRIHRYGYVTCIGSCTTGWFLLNTVTHGRSWSGAECYDSFESVAISGDGLRVAVGNPCADSAGANGGTVQVYDFTTTSYSQVGSDITGRSAQEKFGNTLAMSNDGTRIAVGTLLPTAGELEAGMPCVRIMEYHSSTGWTQLGSDITEPYFSVGTKAVDFFDGYSQASQTLAATVSSSSRNYIKLFQFGTAPPPPPPPLSSTSSPPPSTLGSTSDASQLKKTFTFAALSACIFALF